MLSSPLLSSLLLSSPLSSSPLLCSPMPPSLVLCFLSLSVLCCLLLSSVLSRPSLSLFLLPLSLFLSPILSGGSDLSSCAALCSVPSCPALLPHHRTVTHELSYAHTASLYT